MKKKKIVQKKSQKTLITILHPKKYFHPLTMMGIGILLGIIIMAGIFLLHQKQATQMMNIITYYYPTPVPSSGKQIALPLPQTTDWIDYQPTCAPLQNNVSFAYPKGWQIKEFDTTDPNLDASVPQCAIIIGYPETPSGIQDAPAGQAAEIRISGVVRNDIFTLKAYLENSIGNQASYTPITINGTQFMRYQASDNNYWFLAQKGNLYITIQLATYQTPTSTNTNPIYIDRTREFINNTFLEKFSVL